MVSYVVHEKGEYIIFVKWGDEHIPGSPFRVVAWKNAFMNESFSRKFSWSWFHGKNTLDVLYPQNVRVHLKKYHYTTLKQTMTMMSNQQWWCEKKITYLPIYYIYNNLFVFVFLMNRNFALFKIIIILSFYYSILSIVVAKIWIGKKLIFIYNTI